MWPIAPKEPLQAAPPEPFAKRVGVLRHLAFLKPASITRGRGLKSIMLHLSYSRIRSMLVASVVISQAVLLAHTAEAIGPFFRRSPPPKSQTVMRPNAPALPDRPPLVPGTGSLAKGVTDDFEDENWKWYYNHPKSSEEQDERMRSPLGRSANRVWFEGPKRGTPDTVQRVALPAPGLEGSEHGLLIATLRGGVPGYVSGKMMQDDLIFDMKRLLRGGMNVSNSPSVVVRVYMPPFDQWENRSGPSFGFRTGCYTHTIITGEDHPNRGEYGLEEYWPGMFICFENGDEQRYEEDGAYIRIRSGRNGGELMGKRIDELGWWTLGIAFSPDGVVHYFASPGVDDLTEEDHITSQYPYGYRTETFKTFFFNVCSQDNGKTWSTPWVIDDPKVYFVPRNQMARQPEANRR